MSKEKKYKIKDENILKLLKFQKELEMEKEKEKKNNNSNE